MLLLGLELLSFSLWQPNSKREPKKERERENRALYREGFMCILIHLCISKNHKCIFIHLNSKKLNGVSFKICKSKE